MTIEVKCPNCDKQYRVSEERAAKRLKCRNCGNKSAMVRCEKLDDNTYKLSQNFKQSGRSSKKTLKSPHKSLLRG